MKRISFYSYCPEDSLKIAEKIAKFLTKKTFVGFWGELGSGKTTFIRGLAKGLGIKAKINSPSFVIVKAYPLRKRLQGDNKRKKLFYHLDLYRLNSVKELKNIGVEEFIFSSGISVVEWADRLKNILPDNYLKIQLKIKGQDTRLINIAGYGKEGENLLERIKIGFKGRVSWNQ